MLSPSLLPYQELGAKLFLKQNLLKKEKLPLPFPSFHVPPFLHFLRVLKWAGRGGVF